MRIPHPPADKAWSSTTRKAWLAYWQSEVAALVTKSEWPELLRYFSLLDQQEHLLAEGQKVPLTVGSLGHLIPNPLLTRGLAMNTTLRELGDRYGRNPTARIRLLGRHARANGGHPVPPIVHLPTAALDLDEE